MSGVRRPHTPLLPAKVTPMLGTLRATVSPYIRLTKPGILRLLVFTTITTMIVAQKGIPDLALMLWTLIGTTMVCGSANTINQIWDQDIDQIMSRTMGRPLVTGELHTRQALAFAAVMGLGGMLVLTFLVNPMAALMGLAGHVFYVVIYTMWLKRSTPQNIVIGGAAGAFPPLIGWAAVTGDLSWTAWLIFMVIFLWTPPHFWALALYKDVEYGKANIPMMPVVRGHHVTKLQMLIYTMFLIGCTMLLAVVGTMGLIFLGTAMVAGAGFAYCCIRTAFDEGDAWPKKTFAYSILYLALIFGAMSVDSFNTLHFSEERELMSIQQEAGRRRAQQTAAELRARHNGEPVPSATDRYQ